MITTTSNTGIASELANVVRLVLKKACLNEEIPISGKILVKDQEGTFYSDAPKGEFLVSAISPLSMLRTGIEQALGILVPKYRWTVESRGKNTFFITSVPTDWNQEEFVKLTTSPKDKAETYAEFLTYLTTDELVDEIVYRVGS